jgi:hypothetical protein
MSVKSQHTNNSTSRLNGLFKRLADALDRHNVDREYERTLARVQDALNDRGPA